MKNVSPLRKFVSRSRAKMDQALPPLGAFRSGGSKVIRRLLRGRREKPGDEANHIYIYWIEDRPEVQMGNSVDTAHL